MTQTAHTIQYVCLKTYVFMECMYVQENKPNQKVGKRPKETFLQSRHTDG